MWVANNSAAEVNALRLSGSINAPRQSIFIDPYDPTQEVTWLESLAASFQRENTMVSANAQANAGTGASDAEIERAHVRDWNPYTYLRNTYEEADLQDVMPYILSGELEETYSDRQVEAILADLRRELELQRRAAENPGAALFGGLLGAVADPTSFIPLVGVAGRASRLGRTGAVMGNAALSASVSELALQSSQRTRSIEETLMNIGTAGVIGGGIGYFAGAAYRNNTLHPSHPNNPLRRENLRAQPEMVRTVDGEVDELTPDEIARLAQDFDDAIGAARTDGTQARLTDSETELARGTPKTAGGRAVRALGDFFNSKTIVGRMVRAQSGEARRVGMALMDPGGILLKGHLKGKTQSPAAENIKDALMVRAERLSTSMRESVVQLRIEMGKRVDEADVYRLTQRTLYEMDDTAFFDDLIKRYGQSGFNKMVEKAKANADDIHRTNDDFEAMLVEKGILQDQAVIARLTSELERAKADVATAKEAGDEAALTRARLIRDDRKKQLFQESQKAAPMGRDYGHAQMWNRDVLIENPHEAKAFLRDALLDRPSGDWLAEPPYEMTPAEFAALRETDRARYDEILDDWAGSADYHRLRQAEEAVNAAQAQVKAVELDLNDTLRNLRMIKREQGQVKLSQARKVRDKFHAKLEAARAEKAELDLQLRLLNQAKKPPKNTRSVKQRSGQYTKKPEIGLEPKTRQKAEVQSAAFNAKRLELRAQRDKVARQVDRRQDELARADAALAKVEARQLALKDAKAQLAESLRLQREAGKITAKDLRGAKRQLKKAQGDTPLDKLIDDVFNSLTTQGRMPQAIMDRITRESDRTTGRVKDRIITLDKEQRMAGIKAGYLQDDLPQILFNQYDQVSAELAIREALEIGPNARFASWNERLRFVEEEYNQMIVEAGSRAAKDRLARERNIVLDDLVAARDRIRGQVMTSDGTSYGWANWLSSKMRAIQFARFGGGFLFTSMTDMATMSLRTGGFGKAVVKHGRSSARAALNMSKGGVPQNDMEAFVASMELGIGAAVHARRFGSEDLINGPYGGHGIGTGRTRKVTGAIDKGTGWINEKVGILSGLPLWNRTMKIMSGHMMAGRIRDHVAKYDSLKAAEIADLASVGIGKAEAKRLNTLISKYGNTVDGRFDPGLERWPADDARTFLIAIQRDMNRAINTPGVGDTPRLMDTWWGKAWLQFQTFAFTFINRYAYPTTQRIALGDRKAMASLIWMVGASAMVVAFKDLLRGNDPTERYSKGKHADTFYEILDRSGMMGWTSPYVDSALKLAGFGGLERYARQNALGAIAGVNYGFITDINKAAVAAIDADPDAVDKLLTLSPMSTQLRLFNRLMIE